MTKCWGYEEEGGNYCLIGTESPFGMEKISADAWWSLYNVVIYSVLLNCMLKNGEKGKFYIFYLSKRKERKKANKSQWRSDNI